MAGFPLTHIGHYLDLFKNKDVNIIGLSKKNGIFNEGERRYILNSQLDKGFRPKIMFVNSPAETFIEAYHMCPSHKRNLRIRVGTDRYNWAVGLKHSLNQSKFKEMGKFKFDKLKLDIVPRNVFGYSGTMLRSAVYENNYEKVNKLINVKTNLEETIVRDIFTRLTAAVASGELPIKR